MKTQLTTMEKIEAGKSKPEVRPFADNDTISKALAEARRLRNRGRDAQIAALRAQQSEADAAATQDTTEVIRQSVAAGHMLPGDEARLGLLQPVATADSSADRPDDQSQSEADETTDELDPEDVPITRTINGRQVTKTFREWVEVASKVESADEYLAQAEAHARRRRQEEETLAAARAQVSSDEEDLALVKALQEGSHEEGLAALRRLREQAALKASSVSLARTREEQGKLVAQKVADANHDIAADPYLFQMACAEDVRLQKEGRVFDRNDEFRNFELRFTEAFKTVREWYQKKTGTVAQDLKREELIKKKERLATLASSNSRIAPAPGSGSQRPQFRSEAEYLAHVATQMRRKGNRRVTIA